MLFVGYKKCSTSAKAEGYLTAKEISYVFRDIKGQNPTFEELNNWYHLSGLPLKRLFNTTGMLYKEMNLKDKLPNMTEEEQLQLLATDGMLVKRPILVTENRVLFGFREAEWTALIEK